MLYTEEYQQLLREMHATKNWGTAGSRFIPEFINLYRELNCTTLLDYGSGQESVRKIIEALRSDIQVRCYDPGVVGREAMPEPADFVLCTDVLEHIEPKCADDVLDHLHSLMLKAGFFSIALGPAKKLLPDGNNAHILQQPWEWWIEKLQKRSWRVVKYNENKKWLHIWLKR